MEDGSKGCCRASYSHCFQKAPFVLVSAEDKKSSRTAFAALLLISFLSSGIGHGLYLSIQPAAPHQIQNTDEEMKWFVRQAAFSAAAHGWDESFTSNSCPPLTLTCTKGNQILTRELKNE